MKLQKLTIKNLASIADAVIDFENGPLSQEALFLICGETGAGKTTILDAICLALYNETPRMDRTAGERYRDITQAFANKEGMALINDNRQLMRRNTGEAWAELDFMGTNDTPYTARWYVARARKKADGTLQDVKWTLENRNTHLQLIKKSEIPAEIQAAIGLNFEQFCRTTLLAQGDFTKFLQSKESEKSDILEKLTGTSIYSEIGSRIYAITKEKRMSYEEQNRKLEGIHLLTEEEMEKANECIATQSIHIAHATLQKNNTIQKRDWLKRKAELTLASENQKSVWQEKKELLQSDNFRQKQQLIDHWHTAADARNWFALLNRNRAELKQEEEKADQLQRNFIGLCQGHAWLKTNTQKQQQQLLRIEQYLQKHAHLLPMFEQSQSIITDLQTVLASQQRTSKYEQELKALDEKQPQQEQTCATKEKEFLLRNQENQQKQQEIDKQKTELDAMKRDALQEKRNSLDTDKQKLAKAMSALTLFNEKQAALHAAKEQAQSLNDKIAACQNQHASLQTDFSHKRSAYNDVHQLYDKQKEAVEDWAKEARARLAVGDTCPVCGQEIKSLCQDEDFQSILAPIQAALSTKEKEHKEAELALNNNRTEFNTYQKLMTGSLHATQKAQEGYDHALKEAEHTCKQCGIQGITHATEDALQALMQSNQQELDAIDRKLNEVHLLANAIAHLQQQKDALQKSAEAAQHELSAADKALTGLRNNIANKRALIESEKNTAQATLQRVSPLILWQDWQCEWDDRPTTFIEQLGQASTDYKQTQSKQTELTTAIAFCHKELSGISAAIETIRSAFPHWNETVAAEGSEVKNLEVAWNSLNAQAVGLKQSMLSTHRAMEELQQKLDAFHATHPDFDEPLLASLSAYSNQQIEQLRAELQQLREEVVAHQTACKLTSEQIEAHLKQQPQMNEEDTPESLEVQIPTWEQQISESNQTIGQLQARLKQHELNTALIKDEKERADQLREVFLKWDRLCHHFGDEKGKNFRNIAQSFVLKELLGGANFYLQRLTDRYELECQAGSLTILLRDFYQGGSARPACTLSGGESFLVSLSLALGLSSLSRQSLSVDTLFIDEGFGTLSSDYLNTVMDTLEKLHQLGGKKVGIISHVEGLKERIKTQIQVSRIDNSRSEVKVVSML